MNLCSRVFKLRHCLPNPLSRQNQVLLRQASVCELTVAVLEVFSVCAATGLEARYKAPAWDRVKLKKSNT